MSYIHAMHLATLKTLGKRKAVTNTNINSYFKNLKGFLGFSTLTLPKLFKFSFFLRFCNFLFQQLNIVYLFISFASSTFFFPCNLPFPFWHLDIFRIIASTPETIVQLFIGSNLTLDSSFISLV